MQRQRILSSAVRRYGAASAVGASTAQSVMFLSYGATGRRGAPLAGALDATTVSSAAAAPRSVMARRRATPKFLEAIKKVRNIGISAHIDSGKTTVSERILFYTGKIKAIHEVKGADDVGATMDSMELERERGITIRSAATCCKWKDTTINLIDTPGHVDFTIEVERALRVLDGAVLLVCGVGGVQSQTLTVDRQMKRYGVPRVCFINKLDRDNANPQRAMGMLRERLGINCAFIQLNVGISQDFEAIVDLIEQRTVYFDGKNGENLRYEPIGEFMKADVAAARAELIARLAEVDPQMEELFLEEKEPTPQQFHEAIRRATIANKFVPVMVGSAYRNKGVQLLLDNVERYLPSPLERTNTAHRSVRVDTAEDGTPTWEAKEPVPLATDDEAPLLAMVFKLEETAQVGLSNYVRVYQGRMRKGESLVNVRTQKNFTMPKLVRMHANSSEAVDIVSAGDICAIVGEIDASSGDSFTRAAGGMPCNNKEKVACENMYIPPRVLSLSVKAKDQRVEREAVDRFRRFMREDPTFVVGRNPETDEVVIEGMGELHLQIYVERLKREFGVEVMTGQPSVNYREIIQKKKEFDYVYKRQSGGQGQWAHIKGCIEPMTINMSSESGVKNRVYIKCSNADIKENLQKSVQKQLEQKIFPKGLIMQAPVWGVRFSLLGGAMHEVDSTDIAFRNATQALWEELMPQLEPTLVEPWMDVELAAPAQFMSDVSNEFTKREGVVIETSVNGPDCIIRGETALDSMFGFITDLRKLTKGQGDFSMEFKEYRPMAAYKAQQSADARNHMLGRAKYQLPQ